MNTWPLAVAGFVLLTATIVFAVVKTSIELRDMRDNRDWFYRGSNPKVRAALDRARLLRQGGYIQNDFLRRVLVAVTAALVLGAIRHWMRK